MESIGELQLQDECSKKWEQSLYNFENLDVSQLRIPKHEPIKKVYVELVRQVVESEARNDEDVE